MSNPWLHIPLADYEGHMQLPEVAQLAALSGLFAQTLQIVRPASVAILGIAGGNGLQHIDPKITKRVVGLDLNPHYLDAVRSRYPSLPGLELHCVDLAAPLPTIGPVGLVHAALVFEHAGSGCCIENAVSLVAENGALSVVLQLPSEAQHAVAPTSFPAMQSLQSHFAFVDPAWLTERFLNYKFRIERESQIALPGGKAFWSGLFRL